MGQQPVPPARPIVNPRLLKILELLAFTVLSVISYVTGHDLLGGFGTAGVIHSLAH